jgi:Methyltransferase domain.
MSWKLKAHALAILSRIPAGQTLYHFLQRVAGTNRVQPRRDLDRAFELVDLAQQAGGTIEGAACLEIGTGWHPFVPFVLALGGARRVLTYDVNPWLTFSYALETWKSLELFLPEIAAKCGRPEHEVWDLYRSVPENPQSIRDLFDPLCIQYLCPADARATGLPTCSIDLVVSSNVLEHIPREIQSAIHCETFRILKPEGLCVHRFNPQDHYSTVDASITHGNFLKYSSNQWHWLGGSGLAYHNRLRSPEYRQLFEDARLSIEVFRERIDARTLEEIRSGKLQVHRDFQRFTPEELAVDYVWVVARKPVITRSPKSGAPGVALSGNGREPALEQLV